MKSAYKKLITGITNSQETMVEQLHQFCEINSSTSNLPGLAQMRDALHTAYKPIADTIQIHKFSPIPVIDMSGDTQVQISGDALFISKRPHLKRRVLLSGHMDTVYSPESQFQKLTYINDNCINGPGVTDMKGGLIVMLHALSAFEQDESAMKLGWDVVINADEEIGSPASSVLFDELAAHYQAALVYEPAMTEKGTLAKNRKGSGKITLIATGKSAHAGRDFSEGRNAICYLSEAVCAINELNRKRDGVTINVGKIAGGQALNVVPDKAVAQLDIRINHPEDEFWIRTEFDKIIQKLKRPDYSLSLHGGFGRPVKHINSGTKRLFYRIQHIGKELGISIDWKDSGGCCDGNNLAKHGIPVLDSLGVRGSKIHSEEEYILLDSLPERTALTTLLLLDLAQGGLEDLTK
ncbi:hydrolase [Legionella longbeachae]|uniref:Putative carboxypeptidase G2 and to acetylornithine deacetylase/Succinyl-diaminopimelate desuccinylase n=1 Tax=Legionella longbeachae serogroup 1 (strain NSW150) TaxID=661367 RepID=D3HT43_LEGLN|nr:hydrolase [Legionella longbeachae]CBJ12085.1 putative carboxypeptidase G2 and to acetylornithine deacetylase/Succinyl-diaminopimelate desuccinylase [Legionella longbeachae NSW150]VEE02576.1 carboxypeptidase G2 and to acetylornithine deacetylase/succinyl-diaminopimelate desuccinylase [Legionella oakridgensis]HBD7398833.1 hydrolase [Legionella pneumophila]ARB91160.1 carboxypeptidase [Legionella longbeachae]ARM32413.1 hydrolase [Legionella longbeachae]